MMMIVAADQNTHYLAFFVSSLEQNTFCVLVNMLGVNSRP